MSGHNPHGRLGQPMNPAWNHLQVPSFIPRQPQLAHMSNERGLMGAPPLGWPMHSAETLYGYMAAAAAASAASANHKAVCSAEEASAQAFFYLFFVTTAISINRYVCHSPSSI